MSLNSKYLLRYIKITFLTVMTMTLLGCGTVPTYKGYSDGVENKNELALIECDSEHNHQFLMGLDRRLYIAEIDENSTYSLASSIVASQAYPESALVQPGRHYIRVKYEYFGSYAFGRLWLDAEPGKTYLVQMGINGYEVTFWIIDKETGKPVGGIPGGEPENATTSPEKSA